MARADNAYSRLVRGLKILLPLLALAILSTLFLLSRTIDPDKAIPFANVDVGALMREPRINSPDYSGVTEDGTALRFTAESARPDPARSGQASAILLRGKIETPDGVSTTVTSDDGRIDTGAGLIELRGRVVLSSTLGYQMETTQMVAQLDRTGLETGGPVSAIGPFGTIAAGHMVLSQDAKGTGQYVLVFNGGVKLVYDPEK